MALAPVVPVGAGALLGKPANGADNAATGGFVPVAPVGAAALIAGSSTAATSSGTASVPAVAPPVGLAPVAAVGAAALLGPGSAPAPASEAAVAPPAAPSLADAFGAEAASFVAEQAKISKRVRHLFIMSQPGTGKTTLVQKLLQRLQKDEGEKGIDVAGFYTEEVRDNAGQRAGFDIVRLGGSESSAPRVAIARVGTALPKVGKYSIDMENLENFAIPAIEPPQRQLPPAPALPANPRLYRFADGREEVVSVRSGLAEAAPSPSPSGVAAPSPLASGSPQAPLATPTPPPPPPTPPMSPGETAEAAQGLPAASPEASPCPSEEGLVTIFIPSLNQEQQVEAETLATVPEGWRPPASPADEESEDEGPPRLVICDEIGKMNLLSLKFPAALVSALDSKAVVLGTMPQPAKGQRDHEVIDTVKRRADSRVLRLTRHNRDGLLDQAYKDLRECLDLGAPGTGRIPKPPSKRKLELMAAREAEQKKREEEERQKRENMSAAEKEAMAKKEAKEKKREERRVREAEEKQQREIQAGKAREERKRRLAEKAAAEEAKRQKLMTVDDDDDVDVCAPKVAAVDDEDDVVLEKKPAMVLDVDSKMDPAARRRALRAARVQASPAPPSSPMASTNDDAVLALD